MHELEKTIPETEIQSTPADLIELAYLAQGITANESAQEQNIGNRIVHSRRRRAKKRLKAKTLFQAVATATQKGYIPLTIEDEPGLKPLSYMEDAVLRLMALGWRKQEICARYNVVESTVGKYQVKMREKLHARNAYHAIYRAYEVGIFEPNEEILDPDEQEEINTGGLRIGVDGRVLKLGELGIRNPREVEFIRILSSLDHGWFSRQIIYGNDFYPEAPSSNAKAHAYGRTVLNVTRKFAEGFGETVIEKNGSKGGYVLYHFKRPVSIGPPDDMRTIPAVDKDEILRNKGSRLPRKTSSSKSSPGVPRKIKNTVRPIIVPSQQKETKLSTLGTNDVYLDPEQLPEFDDTLFKNFQSRDPSEVFDRQDVKQAVDAILRSDVPSEYRLRTVLPLRYGIPLNPITYPISISRKGKRVKLHEIVQKCVPAYQGLDAPSTSVVTGLRPQAVLGLELEFLSEYVKDYPCFVPVIEDIRKELSAMSAQEAA